MRRKNGSKRSRHLTSATSRGVKPCFSPALSRQSPLRRASSSSSAPALLTPLQGRPHNTHWIGDPYRPRCQLTGKRANEALNMSSEGGGWKGDQHLCLWCLVARLNCLRRPLPASMVHVRATHRSVQNACVRFMHINASQATLETHDFLSRIGSCPMEGCERKAGYLLSYSVPR